MDNMIVSIALGGFAVILGAAVFLIQKKSGEISALTKKLEQTQGNSEEIQKLTGQLELACKERDDKSAALKKLEQTFEDDMDKVVQSTIKKLAHAEQAKEEAVQAAQDNYEAAADAHAVIREREAVIKQLQSQ